MIRSGQSIGLDRRPVGLILLFPAGFEPPFGKTFRFGILAIPFTPLFQCLSDETLKAVGPFYLVPMPGEVKDPTSPRNCVDPNCRGLHHPL